MMSQNLKILEEPKLKTQYNFKTTLSAEIQIYYVTSYKYYLDSRYTVLRSQASIKLITTHLYCVSFF